MCHVKPQDLIDQCGIEPLKPILMLSLIQRDVNKQMMHIFDDFGFATAGWKCSIEMCKYLLLNAVMIIIVVCVWCIFSLCCRAKILAYC